MRTRRLWGAGLLGLSFLLVWAFASALASLSSSVLSPTSAEETYEAPLTSLLVLAFGMLGVRIASHQRPWAFGWRAPAIGSSWGWLAPLAILGAVPVGAWASASLDTGGTELWAVAAAGLLGLAAIEVWFRGLAHGLLALDFPVQRPAGPWFVSRAALASAAAYAMVVTVVTGPTLGRRWLAPFASSQLEVLAGLAVLAFAVGLALAAIRERSLSIVPGIAIQVLGLLAAAALFYATA